MMAVIVDDGDAIPDAGTGKAPAHAAELGKGVADCVVCDTELTSDRNRRGGIESIVAARHRQRDVLDFVRGATGSFTEQHREQGRSAGMRYVDKAHVGLRVLAVGDDAVILDAAYQILHNGMI